MVARTCLVILLASMAALAEEASKGVAIDQGVTLFLEEKRVEVVARVCVRRGLLELFACAEGGKDHESAVVLFAKPQSLHLALVLLGLKDKREMGGGGPQQVGDPTAPKGDRVLVFLEWTDKEGKTHRHRAEELIKDQRTNTTMPLAGWTFSGSEFVEEVDPDTKKPTGRQIYCANRERSVITTFHDPTAILDNPLSTGGDDSIYYSNEDILPDSGTHAKLIVQVPTDEEKKQLDEAAKEPK